MSLAKFSSEPAICSAIALDASLPDWTMMPRRMSITVAWLLSGKYMQDSELEPRHHAYSLTETRSSFLSLPDRSACSTKKLVIIFVSDAGGKDVLPGAHMTGGRSATTATVTVTGTSLSVIPGWSPAVSQSASVPVERITR